jgi:hypothetical protein
MKSSFKTEIIINVGKFDVIFYIIDDSLITCSTLIEVDFLNTIELYLIRGKITIKKCFKKANKLLQIYLKF